MPELHDTDALSIGEVLGLLLEEFPDVTISKIRFLESQGLIAPERTASGYRKFYEADIELLRVILREQRQNYLPLRVIKDRLDSGEIDPTGEVDRPDASATNGHGGAHTNGDGHGTHDDTNHDAGHGADDGEVPEASVAAHPAARRPVVARRPPRIPSSSVVDLDQARPAGGGAAAATPPADHTPVAPQLLPGVVLDRGELLAMTGI
jgi:DNA-binding transcriptional MerR regulator